MFWTGRVVFSFLLLVCFTGILLFFNVGDWLSRVDQPCTVDVIICLSGNNRVKKAVSLYRQGFSQQLIFTVGTSRDQALKYGIDKASALVTGK